MKTESGFEDLNQSQSCIYNSLTPLSVSNAEVLHNSFFLDRVGVAAREGGWLKEIGGRRRRVEEGYVRGHRAGADGLDSL